MIRSRLMMTIALLVPFFALAAWALWSSKPAPPNWTNSYDVTARPPELIPAGTIIADAPPADWSHLVIKSHPQLRASDQSKVDTQPARLASLLFTAFLADVKADVDGKHRLRRIALGMGTKVNGQDVIFAPDGAMPGEPRLMPLDHYAITRGYAVLQNARVVLQGPTMALVDTPVLFRCGSKNKLVRFRYALLVDGESGRLDALVWGMDPEQGGCFAAAAAIRLAPNTLTTPDLILDPSEITFGWPTGDTAFGIDALPPGKERYAIPADLLPLAMATRFTPEDARKLEEGLRKLMP